MLLVELPPLEVLLRGATSTLDSSLVINAAAAPREDMGWPRDGGSRALTGSDAWVSGSFADKAAREGVREEDIYLVDH